MYVYIDIYIYVYIYVYICTHTYIKGVYQSGSQAVVQPLQQWLSTKGKSQNPVVVQCTRQDVSAGLH